MRQLAVGQVWTIKRSPGPDTRIVIGRIDAEVVHISILEVPVPSDYPLQKGPISIGHSPFARPAIEASIDVLLGSNGQTAPYFEEGYEYWKSVEGECLTVPVSDAIAESIEMVSGVHRE